MEPVETKLKDLLSMVRDVIPRGFTCAPVITID